MVTTSTSERRSDEDVKRDLQKLCDMQNAMQGSLSDYDCPICKNKGCTYVLDGMVQLMRPCSCMEIRAGIQRMKRSGMYEQLDKLTFEAYRVEEQWQKDLLNTAKRYADNHDKPAFFMGGQRGAGKTHLCTAICAALMKQGFAVRYFVWETDVKEILNRSGVSDREEREALVQPLLQSPVVYLDDFFRKDSPSPAERSIAFDVINRRYIEGKITIISSERTMNALLNIDEAIASRIKEMCGNTYCLNIADDPRKNYRLRHSA
ncbi:MAG: ATP-binding protein [Clostridia bacterium]|nr:ATP-binding protein [Clostridia bacterium]